MDEDEAILFYKKEIFILLSQNEKWIPIDTPSESTVGTYIINETGELIEEKGSTDAPINPQSSTNYVEKFYNTVSQIFQ